MLSVFKRTLHVGIKAEKALTSFRAFTTQGEEFSKLLKPHGTGYLLDTCLMEKSLARVFPLNQAKAISSVYFEIWKDGLERLDGNIARKEEIEKIRKRLTQIRDQARTGQEIRTSEAFHKLTELNQDLEFLETEVRNDLDKKMGGVKLSNQGKCNSTAHENEMMYYHSTVTLALSAFLVGALAFFK